MARRKTTGPMETPDKSASTEEEVKSWTNTIARTEQWAKNWAESSGAKRFVKEYEGDWKDLQQNVDIPLIPINLVFAYVKTEISRLYFRDPWITVNAKRQEDIGAAKIAEQLVNYTWGELDLKRQVKLAILDTILVGHGWIKVGYTAQFGIVESKKDKKDGKPLDVNQYVKDESVFAVHYPWDHVLFDPSATWPPAHNARWMAFKWTKPLTAVQQSGLYENTEDLKATNPDKTTRDNNNPAREVKSVSGWEIWDRDNKKVITIVPGHPKALREIDWPDYLPDGFPAVMVSFNPIPGKPYPLSDIAPHEGQIIEATKMMAIMLNHLKRWNRQIFMKPQMMTEEQKKNFQQGVDGAMIEVQGELGKDFFIPPYAPVQQDVYGVWNLVMDIWRNVSGQSDSERGAPGKSNTRTLGELRLVLQGGRARADEKIDSIEDAVSEVARKLLAIMQKKYDLPKIVRIVGPRAVEKAYLDQRPSATGAMKDQSQTSDYSFTATKDDIHGEMDVDTLAGSTVPPNKENQLQIMEKILPVLPNLGIIPGSQASREFGREYLRLIGIQSLERIADMADQEAEQAAQNPQPDPKTGMEIQKAQMDMQIKQQEAQMRMQTDKQKAGLQLEGIQAKTEAQVVKAKLDIEKAKANQERMILESILQQARGGNSGNGGKGGNGNGV